MNWKMFLDDIRHPKTDGWVLCRSFDDAVSTIESYGCFPAYISFDHDLGVARRDGDTKSGYDFAKWLVEQEMNGKFLFPEGFAFNVHSANPVGKENIEKYLESYFRFRGVKNDQRDNAHAGKS